MTLRVAINGFGRIGRNVMRGWISRGADTGIEIVGVNATSDPKTSAHLLTYDSILGKLDPSVKIETTDDSMIVNGKEVKFFSDRNPLNCPWKEWGVDLVLESTGVFNTDEKASMHIQAGAKKVILTAPGKGPKVGTFVVGVNEDQYRHEDFDILSNASCTTNCLAPLVKVIDQSIGINRGLMTTIHSYTGDQRILDNNHRDLRRAVVLSMVSTVVIKFYTIVVYRLLRYDAVLRHRRLGLLARARGLARPPVDRLYIVTSPSTQLLRAVSAIIIIN